MLYFAYGSNLHPARLRNRIGDLELVSTAILHGRRLVFHKRGQDGSAKCDSPKDPSPSAVVHGALYRIDGDAVRVLDRFEGRGCGYEVEEIQVISGNREVPAFTYLAQPGHIDDHLLPFTWYRALVLAGARYHEFPQDYIQAIASVEAMTDPDPERDRKNLSLLEM